jgi:sulfatase modifying factor 1
MTATIGILVALIGDGWLQTAPAAEDVAAARTFVGSTAGEERTLGGVSLCWCPPGRFRMGSPVEEAGHRADEAAVEVTLSRGFWMGKFEVTQAQWSRVVGPFPQPQNGGAGADVPVHWVSFLDAEDFCRRLTQQAREAGELREPWEFRLPTEAQWEYACRAGTATAFSSGATLTKDRANFGQAYNGRPSGEPETGASRVGRYPANAWGLCDMHGNEWEWCRDWYHPRLPGGTDPDLSTVKGAVNRDGTHSRVRRGGAWVEPAEFCRSAVRLRYEPERRSDHIGFRMVLVQK